MTSVAFGLEKLKAKEIEQVQGDCAAVVPGLPQLKMLGQEETESYFELTVI